MTLAITSLTLGGIKTFLHDQAIPLRPITVLLGPNAVGKSTVIQGLLAARHMLSTGSVEIDDSNGNSIKMESSGVTVTASAKVTINASNVEVSAGMVTVNSGMSRFSGVVQADTVISNSVISASYTPGAGNIW